LFLFYIFL